MVLQCTIAIGARRNVSLARPEHAYCHCDCDDDDDDDDCDFELCSDAIRMRIFRYQIAHYTTEMFVTLGMPISIFSTTV